MYYLTINTDDVATVAPIIQSEFRLDELVAVTDRMTDPATLTVRHGGIEAEPDWRELLPPVLLPRPLPLTPDNLLTVVYARLDNWEKAYEHARHYAPLAEAIDLTNRLQSGVAVAVPTLPVNGVGTFERYQRSHNRAVALHYGTTSPAPTNADLTDAYRLAIDLAPDAEHRAFTAKHFATYLLDTGQLTEANTVLQNATNDSEPADSQHELLAVQYAVWLQQLTVPYDPALLDRTKIALWQVLQHYEKQQRTVQVGLLLIDAAQVANFQNSFAESLGYINRAVTIFRDEDVPELLANAQYRKGVLLYTWAQNGNPQFYRPAMEAYQEALKVFTQQQAPAIFAEIQHHLGVIYSEIPDEVKKKSIWAAVSSSSFQQALAYYTPDAFPYEYATICNHYANALTKYPPAARSDNYAKAMELYRSALRIRTAAAYPYERALTILNYLEAGWYVGEEDPFSQRLLHDDMMKKAYEIDTLVADEALQTEARQHRQRLELVVINQ